VNVTRNLDHNLEPLVQGVRGKIVFDCPLTSPSRDRALDFLAATSSTFFSIRSFPACSAGLVLAPSMVLPDH
jgi:hypothetical protein